MQDHNEYLRQIEEYLSDLSVMEKVKLMGEINSEISIKPLSELENALSYTNSKRTQHGFDPFKKNFSIFRFIFKSFAIMALIMALLVALVIWKFTPILSIDEQSNRVIVLGGLIDIDGRAGKFKVFDNYQFSDENYTNDLQVSFGLQDDQDEIIVNFNSGTFTATNSPNGELKIDCKLSLPASKEVIQQFDDYLKIDLTNIDGTSCNLQIPEDKKIILDGKAATIQINEPEFNVFIELESGRVAIKPQVEVDYLFNLELGDENGYIGEFESSDAEKTYEIKVDLGAGSIIRK